MPTIDVSFKDICNLLKKKLTIKELKDLLLYVKGEIDSQEGDRLKIDIKETNRPELWSTEGICRVLKSQLRDKLKTTSGLFYKTKKSGIIVEIDKNLEDIRPLTVAAVARNVNIDDETLFQMIQLQEKICTSFGNRRKEVALGLYDLHKITPPIKYKGFKPTEIKFIPLDFDKPLNLKQILEMHPKGIEYGHLLEGKSIYPVFIDSKNQVLSFPPIINSDYTGKVTKKTKDIFVECSGFHLRFLLPALNAIITALAERGADIETVDIKLPNGKIITTPQLNPKKIVFKKELVKKISGLDLSDSQIKNLLEKAMYQVKIEKNNITVIYPAYRQDIMHPVDVIEDILVSYGYNDIEPLTPKLATKGQYRKENFLANEIGNILIGLGAQEIMSYTLTNNDIIFTKMNLEQQKAIEIENPVSKNWSVFRTWLVPSLIEFISKNKMKDLPQRIFEIGEVVIPDDNAETKSVTLLNCSYALIDKNADFTKAKQALDFLLGNLKLKYEIEAYNHSSFLSGRCAKLFVNKKEIGIIGEINPVVLENWSLEYPICVFEINVNSLVELVKFDLR